MSKSQIAMLPMAALLAMEMAELTNLAKIGVKTADKVKEASENNKATIPALGKVIAALKKRFNAESAQGSLASTLTFPEYFKMVTGGGKVNNHAESCGKAFGFYVDNGLVPEVEYDRTPADLLEKSASVVTLVGGDLTRSEVLDAAEIVNTRPKDGARKLQDIIEHLKGPKTIDSKKAVEYLTLIYKSGLHITVFASLGAEVRNEKDAGKLRIFREHAQLVLDGCNAPASKPATPATPAAPESAPVETPAAPAAAPSAEAIETNETETPNFELWVRENFDLKAFGEEHLPGIIADAERFHAACGNLPESDADLLNWCEENQRLAAEAAA